MDAGKANKTYLYLGIAGLFVGLGLLFAIRNRRKTVKFSQSLVGQTEIAGNAGFTNERFQQLMQQVGWRAGDAWCVYFVKLLWYNMAPAFLKPVILKKVSGSSVQTWQSLQDDPSFEISKVPRPGDMAVWRIYKDGQPTSNGHAGLVTMLGYGNFTTIEGNTSSSGGSEGYIVAEKTRNIDFTTTNGLRLMGFIRFA